jgi:urea transport system permease protein
VRLAAADELAQADESLVPLLRAALAKETASKVKEALSLALARHDLQSPSLELRLAALETLRQLARPATRGEIEALLRTDADKRVQAAGAAALSAIAHHESLVNVAGSVVYGLSLASVFLFAALGLAITFGVMGVINMAHGEMLTIGAYTTYAVQVLFQKHFPAALPFYLFAAIPAGLRGGHRGRHPARARRDPLALRTPARDAPGHLGDQPVPHPDHPHDLRRLERGGGQPRLAGRRRRGDLGDRGPLQPHRRHSVRDRGGPVRLAGAAQDHARPAGAGGGAEPGHGLVHGRVHQAHRHVDLRPRLGHRRPGRVALSQIGNVGPELGQGYILDSFMVVVLGGVGRIAGTICAALGLGIVQKFLEPLSGAVLGKIAVLVVIILFIQRRPAGDVPGQGPGGGLMLASLRQTFLQLHSPRRWLALTAVAVVVLGVVPLLNGLPAGSALRVPDHLIPLFGKFLCYALVALAMDLIWGYAGILSLGHGLFFALGGYAMGMYLMRSIRGEGVYRSELPDFMVFLDWKTLPWYWQGFSNFHFALAMALVVPGLLAFLFGYLAFRSRIRGVYFSIVTQALTYAAMLLFFRNNTGFGGNNGLTTSSASSAIPCTRRRPSCTLYIVSAGGLVLAYLACRVHRHEPLRSRADRHPRRRAARALLRLRHHPLQAASCGPSRPCCAAWPARSTSPRVGIINPSEMQPSNSIEMAVWVAVGGRGSLVGGVLGAWLVNGPRAG